MRASRQEQTGAAGISEVTAKFQRIGWGPVPNEAHDLGTDLLVLARDRRRFDRGLVVGAQVKAGPSWFKDEERDEDGEVRGWWYYESEAAHFDDWVTHGLPHLLVLHDLDRKVSHWAHVTADRVASTGKGCKILVPREQTIDEDHLDELLAVAAQQKAAPKLEGTSFSASAGGVAPSRRLRYALLAARLVAPHRNAGYDAPITPEEAVALCAQGRFLDLQRFSEKHDSVPDPRQPYNGRDWRWSFVRAFWTWSREDDLAGLRSATAAAPAEETKAAATVLLSCALLRVDRVAEAHTLLDDLLAKDDLGPVDHAWVLVQRARLRTEVGDVAGAREDAVDAQRQFPGDEDDRTVSALAAAAAWLLFSTASFGAGDLAGTLTAADTAIAWWRSQTISWALGQAAEHAFHAWAQDTTTRTVLNNPP